MIYSVQHLRSTLRDLAKLCWLISVASPSVIDTLVIVIVACAGRSCYVLELAAIVCQQATGTVM